MKNTILGGRPISFAQYLRAGAPRARAAGGVTTPNRLHTWQSGGVFLYCCISEPKCHLLQSSGFIQEAATKALYSRWRSGPQQPILFLDCSEGAQSFSGSFESWVNWDSEIFLSKLPKPASFIWFPSPPRFLSKISSIKLLRGNVSILSAFAMYGQIQHTHPAHKNLIIHISKRDIKRHNLICSHWKNHELHIPEHRIFNNPNYWSCLH